LEALATTVNQMAGHLQQSAEAKLKAERLMALHRLSTVLTHDLRSPMVGILKALALLEETYEKMPKPQAQRLLADLVRGGNLLLGTLNDLLDVYRHSLSALPLRATVFVLSDAAHDVARLLEADASARGVKLETTIAAPERRLTADRRRLQRVLFNLLDNAIKHSPAGGVVGLRVSWPDSARVVIDVEDQGPGIPEGERAKIFDFLYEAGEPRHGSDRHECSSIGVGLYFCRMAVEAHGGRIDVENRPEGGARFTAILPVEQPE
ncbi:MAG: ATP-binding protein, partial [Nitrospirota bacterium]